MKTTPTSPKTLAALSAAIVYVIFFAETQVASANVAGWVGNAGVTASTNWSDGLNWTNSAGGGPGPLLNDVKFNEAGSTTTAGTITSVVDTDQHPFSLQFTNNSFPPTNQFHTVLIPDGVTLTNDNALTVGGVILTNYRTIVTITGGGTLVQKGALSIGNNNTAATGGADTGTLLDLSGLNNFIFTASAATITMGSGNRSAGDFRMAAVSNYVTAATWNANTASSSSAATGTLTLGAGTNIINVNTFNLALQRNSCPVNFPATGGLRMRGTGGTDSDRVTVTMGNHSATGTGSTAAGSWNFNGHPVDIKLATVTLGQSAAATTGGSNPGNGTINFDTGIIDATTINMAIAGNTVFNSANGTITMGSGATLIVGSGGISLCNMTGSATAAIGTLTINGGTATVGGNIVKTTAAGTGNVTVNTGSLAVSGRIGSVAIPVDNLNLSDANLTVAASATTTNVAVINLTTGGSTNTINISSVPGITSYPAQFPLMTYAGAIGGSGFDNNVGLGSLPAASPSYEGYLSNDTASLVVYLVITNGPAPAQPISWTGNQSGAWDTSTLNWLAGAAPTNYNNAGDFVTFPDNASTSTVYLVTSTLTPGGITVSNQALTYTFTGGGKLSGATGLTKQGSGTLILDNSGVNDFSGNMSITGTLQAGTGGTTGNLPNNGAVANNGTLNLNRSANGAMANVISGTGAVVKNGANTLTFSGANTFAGGLTVNAGVLRLGAANNGGTGTITANSGGTVVFSAAQTNAGIILAGGTWGSSLNLNPLVDDLTAAASTTSYLYMADPQNLTLADGNETAFSGTWHGSGTIIVATVLNDPTPDGGNGFRLRGTAPSDFSGVIVLSNSVKGELQTTVAGPFSPAGTGKLVLYGGVLTNNTVTGNFSELNLRNNSGGSTVLGNNVELAGTGLAVLDPLGTAPAGTFILMGNLRIGAGQELGVNLNAAPDHVVVFQSVTLTGGMVTFSPKTPGWNTTPMIGSDLTLNNISETSSSSLVMNGLRTLTLAGNNNYSGSTVVSNGTLLVEGVNQGGDYVNVYAGGTLGGLGTIGAPVTIAVNGTLSPGNPTTPAGTLRITNSLALGGTNVMDVNKSGVTFTGDLITNVTTLTYGGTLRLNLTGDPLAAGDSFKLYSFNSANNSFAAIIPATPGTDLVWDTSELNQGRLKVASSQPPPAAITNSVSGNQLTMTWPNGQGWRMQAADALDDATVDMDPAPNSPLNVTLPGSEPQQYYRLRYGTPAYDFYDTEMLALDISGGSLPAGVQIRVSPTLPSTGKTAIQPGTNGTFTISSYFNMNIELSLNSGSTWTPPTNGWHRVKLKGPPFNIFPTNTVPPISWHYTNHPPGWFAFIPPNIVLTNIVHFGWTNSYPPPPPGGVTNDHSFFSIVDGRVSFDGGNTFNLFSAPANATVRVISRP